MQKVVLDKQHPQFTGLIVVIYSNHSLEEMKWLTAYKTKVNMESEIKKDLNTM